MILSNGIVKLELDEQCRITVLESIKHHTGNLICNPAPIFRFILKTGENWEDVAYAKNAETTFENGTDSACIKVNALHTRMGNHPIEIEFRITLKDEKVLFDAVINNHSESTVVDFLYPCIGSIHHLKGQKPGLLLPLWYGEYHTNIIDELSGSVVRDGRSELSETYPGNLSMQWMTLMGGGMSMYLGSHDPALHTTAMRAVGQNDGVVLEIDKMAFAEPNKNWTAPQTVLWLYEGSWQPGAELYREWANSSWRKQVEPKQWVKDMTGYLLVINKQQYGDILWPYQEIPALYDMAQSYGFNTLGLFGWYESGHDTMYPDLEVAECMGGEKKLREGIEYIHQHDGRITLYLQGHLIDVNSPYYREHGDEVETKTRWGNPYYEQYNKFTNSDFLRSFTRKVFATACPHSRQWQELMAEKADWVHSFGVDGVLYDQIGGRPSTPCFSKKHGHENPSTSFSQGRLQLLSRIRKQADQHNEYAFFTEMLTDAYAQNIDCIHAWRNHADVKASRSDIESNSKPRVILTPGVLRHTFPDVISTVRNYRPYIDPRTVNHCLCYGLRMEMELRTLKDLELIEEDFKPEWRNYSYIVSLFRQKYADLLLNGCYHCDADLSTANPALHHGRFTSEDKECIVFWNDTDETLPIDMAGHNASRWETPFEYGDGVPKTIHPNSLIVLF